MPSTATITAFYNFSANTKARASQVNGNFDIFRGHIIPVEVLTATSANNTYDLGSNEYRWRNGYINNLYIGLTSTGWSMIDETSTSGDLVIKKNGVNRLKIPSTVGVLTTTSDGGYVARSGTINFGTSSTAETVVTNSTLTISSLGRGVMLRLVGLNATTSSFFLFSSGSEVDTTIRLKRNNVNIKQTAFRIVSSAAEMNPEVIQFYDYEATTGSNIYHISLDQNSTGTLQQTISNCYLIAYAL